MNHVDTMMTLYQQEVVSEKNNYQQIGWTFEIGLNVTSLKSLLFTTEDILSMYDSAHIEMQLLVRNERLNDVQCEDVFGSVRKTGKNDKLI